MIGPLSSTLQRLSVAFNEGKFRKRFGSILVVIAFLQIMGQATIILAHQPQLLAAPLPQ